MHDDLALGVFGIVGALVGFGICLFVNYDKLPNLTACAKEHNVYECELIAVPKGMKLLPPTAMEEE